MLSARLLPVEVADARPTKPAVSQAPRPRRVAEAASDVLAINRVGFLGGVERVILTAAAGASANGWITALACPPGELEAEARLRGMWVTPAQICSLNRAEVGKNPAAWARTVGRLERGRRAILHAAATTQARVLHVHHPVTAVQARRAAKARRAPLIWHVHETSPAPLHYRALATIAMHACDLIVCVSEASRDMVRELGAPAARTRVVYNAVEARFLDAPPAGRERLDDAPNIGVFGVLEPRKGHADLIRACALLAPERPGLTLWIVGGSSFEQHRGYPAELEALARDVGIGDRVRFTGRRDDVPALMAQMDAVVCAATHSESLPTVLIEACALGVPVLGTDVGGTREIIQSGETGMLVRAGAPAALAQGLRVLLTDAGRSMARQAQAQARVRFSPARFAADLDDCYRELVGAPAGAVR